jgi:hypothetical protein
MNSEAIKISHRSSKSPVDDIKSSDSELDRLQVYLSEKFSVEIRGRAGLLK